jgi:hypothetical protein
VLLTCAGYGVLCHSVGVFLTSVRDFGYWSLEEPDDVLVVDQLLAVG